MSHPALAPLRRFGEAEAQLVLAAYARTSSLLGVVLVVSADLAVRLVRLWGRR
jgi:hypothetical protein